MVNISIILAIIQGTTHSHGMLTTILSTTQYTYGCYRAKYILSVGLITYTYNFQGRIHTLFIYTPFHHVLTLARSTMLTVVIYIHLLTSIALPHLARYSVWSTKLVPPVAHADRNHRQLCQNDGSSNGSRYLLRAFDAQTHMPVAVTHGNEGLEPCPLTSTRLLLDWHDLEYFIFQRVLEEEVNDLCLFDGNGEEIDVLQALDFTVLDQPSKLCHRDPL